MGIEQCYGQKASCSQRETCEFGDACLSRWREDRGDIHFRKTHIFLEENKLEKAITNYDVPEAEKRNENEKVVFCDIELEPAEYSKVITVLERVSYMFFNKNTVFNALMYKIYKNMNQNDLSKIMGVTRQNINQKLWKELNIDQKRNSILEKRNQEILRLREDVANKEKEMQEKDDTLRSLSPRDVQIYKLRFIDGCTAQSTAIQMNCDIRTVFRVTKELRQKMNIQRKKAGRPCRKTKR